MKTYKEDDLDHNPELPLVVRQAIALAIVTGIVLLVAALVRILWA